MNVTDFEQVLMDHQTLKENMNHYFLLSMGALVMLMQAGFAMIEAATVRSKNTTSILIKNISDMCFGIMKRVLATQISMEKASPLSSFQVPSPSGCAATPSPSARAAPSSDGRDF